MGLGSPLRTAADEIPTIPQMPPLPADEHHEHARGLIDSLLKALAHRAALARSPDKYIVQLAMSIHLGHAVEGASLILGANETAFDEWKDEEEK